MYHSTSEFTEKGLSQLVDHSQPLSAIFFSYNDVGSFKANDVITRNGLTVTIKSGDTDYNHLLKILGLGIIADMQDDPVMKFEAIEGFRRKSEEGLQRATADADTLVSSESDALVVLYAGLTSFDQSLDFGCSIRERAPKTRLVVVTCDCDWRRKEFRLKHLVANGTVHAVVTTTRCGGVDAMGKLVENFVSYWTENVPEPAIRINH